MNHKCRWYDQTSGMKRAFDKGLLDKKWIENYCLKGGKNCIRKKRFEEEGYVSPDYVLPDGSIDEKLKKIIEEKGYF
ncbi:MAG: uracil-DNA glycosylase [Candidatus Atribacteria bacterium]|nr:uracil-DNA glycosylase [Candidatus Atribacteria bacterium]